MDIGAQLRAMRKRRGFTQEQLAERMHISRSNIAKLEGNKLKLSLEDAFRWANQTDSQDMMLALSVNMMNVDISSVIDMLTNMGNVANILWFLGGLI